MAEWFLTLVEEFMESWVRWREACDDVLAAYERWGECEASDRRLAFASYRAALDREEHAARVYSRWTDRVHDAWQSIHR